MGTGFAVMLRGTCGRRRDRSPKNSESFLQVFLSSVGSWRWHILDWFPECAGSLGLAYALAGRLTDALPLLEQAVE